MNFLLQLFPSCQPITKAPFHRIYRSNTNEALNRSVFRDIQHPGYPVKLGDTPGLGEASFLLMGIIAIEHFGDLADTSVVVVFHGRRKDGHGAFPGRVAEGQPQGFAVGWERPGPCGTVVVSRFP